MDNLDKKIISILQEDGRASLSSIGREVGMSHVAVSKRLENLCEKLVKVSAGLNAKHLGFRMAIVNAEVETPERLRELIDIFSKCPRIVFLTTTTGAYNLMIVMVAEDADILKAIIEVCSVRAQKGIRRSEAIIGEAPVIPKYLPIKIVANKEDEDAPCGINCGKCLHHREKNCLGCPATKYYKGPL
ncbi:MAG: AsnC family transcriptional regulator [Candidatus Methanomethylicia archaeon]|nr:AsnC family transcriptional regulator [Candidatus Methanomethylicia archaeon]